MRRTWLIVGISAALSALVIGAAVVLLTGPGQVLAQTPLAEGFRHFDKRGWGGWHRGAAPAGLEMLADVPPEERFEHMRQIEFKFTDDSDSLVTVLTVAGTVESASATSLEIKANDGSDKSYTLDGNTRFVGMARSASDLAAGDKVMVSAIDGGASASSVVEPPPPGSMMRGRMGRHHGPWAPDGQPATPDTSTPGTAN